MFSQEGDFYAQPSLLKSCKDFNKPQALVLAAHTRIKRSSLLFPLGEQKGNNQEYPCASIIPCKGHAQVRLLEFYAFKIFNLVAFKIFDFKKQEGASSMLLNSSIWFPMDSKGAHTAGAFLRIPCRYYGLLKLSSSRILKT